jgi:hypothetical protein
MEDPTGSQQAGVLRAVGGSESDEDDTPQLSDHALAALQEFYREQQAVQGEEAAGGEASLISENWVIIYYLVWQLV